MSFHYTVCLATGLRRDMPAVDVALLEYVFNKVGNPPALEPNDSLRTAVLDMDWIREWFAHGSDPDRASHVDVSRDPAGGFISIQLALFSPGHKLESIYGDWPNIFRWLATLTVVDGHFATVICEDGDSDIPTLFYSYDRKLFMQMTKDWNCVGAYDSDEQRTIPGR